MSKLREGSIGDIGASTAAPTVTDQGTPGSTSSTYVIVSNLANGKVVRSTATVHTTGHATPSGTNFNRITWAAVAGSVSDEVWRIAGGATQGKIATVLAGATRQVDDIPIAGDGGTITTKTAVQRISDLEKVRVHISGTFTGTWILKISFDGGTTYVQFATGTAAALSDELPPCGVFQVTCATFTSGSIVCNYGGRVAV